MNTLTTALVMIVGLKEEGKIIMEHKQKPTHIVSVEKVDKEFFEKNLYKNHKQKQEELEKGCGNIVETSLPYYEIWRSRTWQCTKGDLCPKCQGKRKAHKEEVLKEMNRIRDSVSETVSVKDSVFYSEGLEVLSRYEEAGV